MLILRHAWLNLWDKHMTTGRINQITNSKTSADPRLDASLVWRYISRFPSKFSATFFTSLLDGDDRSMLNRCHGTMQDPKLATTCDRRRLFNGKISFSLTIVRLAQRKAKTATCAHYVYTKCSTKHFPFLKIRNPESTVPPSPSLACETFCRPTPVSVSYTPTYSTNISVIFSV